jgi:MFS family permease
MIARRLPLGKSLGQNYAFVVVGVIFIALLVTAGLRSSMSVLLVPLEDAFGWSREFTSASAAIGIFLYGLMGPFAAALMERFGVRRTMIAAVLLMAAATASSTAMSQPWHLVLTWGVLSGIGSGCITFVLAATMVNRWFTTNRGLIMGLLTASAATGTLVFLPGLAALASSGGWRPAVWAVAAAMLALLPLVFWLLPEHPRDIGLVPYGSAPDAAVPAPARRVGLLTAAFGTLFRAAQTRAFWFLFATFYVCGFTTNGLVGTHLIALCGDQGITEVHAAGLLALMGIFDLAGTTASGWLTDRYDPRKLLFMYYGLRGISLICLPYTDFSVYSLSVFAVFYGLDWIATVPPTVRLTTEAFGERDAPVIFGWIVAGHQLGAASAAYFAGAMRAAQGSYGEAFIIAGMTGVVAAVISLMIRGKRRTAPAAA